MIDSVSINKFEKEILVHVLCMIEVEWFTFPVKVKKMELPTTRRFNVF